MPDIEKRRLGTTDLALPILGFGAAALGNLFTPIEKSTAQAALRLAWETGRRYYDTRHYTAMGLVKARWRFPA